MCNPFASERRALALALVLVACATIVRLAVLFVTPVELYPDEAQYWVWSRDLAWGYFSKPPMVAWLIAATTAIGGDSEAWVRISSVMLHGVAPLFMFATAQRLYGPREALLTVAIYSLMPGVQLSAGIASTDAPLLFFLSGALWAYVRLLEAPPTRLARAAWGAAVGLFLGLACLSKYAAVYFIVGLIVHGLVSAQARRAWRPIALTAAVSVLALMVAPNFGWNAHNGFATFAHTARNADWSATSFLHVDEVFDFLASQLGVFGPVPFVALAIGTFLAFRRPLATGPDKLLLVLTLPPLCAVAIEALLSRANANWAFTAYVPGSILAAAWLVRWRARWWTLGGLAVQAGVAVLFLACVVQPSLADALGLANSLKRARGWRVTADAILDRAQAEPTLSAVAVDNRFVFNELRYYGRERLARTGAPPIRMWVREALPLNQAEMQAPLTGAVGGRVMAVSRTPEFRTDFVRDFTRATARPLVSIRLDRLRTRDLTIFIAEGYWRRPRDPITGLPRP